LGRDCRLHLLVYTEVTLLLASANLFRFDHDIRESVRSQLLSLNA
jgi:hypothetical protein